MSSVSSLFTLWVVNGQYQFILLLGAVDCLGIFYLEVLGCEPARAINVCSTLTFVFHCVKKVNVEAGSAFSGEILTSVSLNTYTNPSIMDGAGDGKW